MPMATARAAAPVFVQQPMEAQTAPAAEGAAFDVIDQNHDGVISRAEFNQAMQQPEQPMAAPGSYVPAPPQGFSCVTPAPVVTYGAPQVTYAAPQQVAAPAPASYVPPVEVAGQAPPVVQYAVPRQMSYLPPVQASYMPPPMQAEPGAFTGPAMTIQQAPQGQMIAPQIYT